MTRTWSAEAIRVHKNYLEKEKATLDSWKRILTHHEESVIRAKNMVEFLEISVDEFKREIAKQEVTK